MPNHGRPVGWLVRSAGTWRMALILTIWDADGSDPGQAGNSLNFCLVNPIVGGFRRETTQFLRDDRLSPKHV